MEEYLYRYISFDAFVGMIQSQSLTFVLPELWDDPKECASFKHYVEKLIVPMFKHYYGPYIAKRFVNAGPSFRKAMQCGEFIHIIIEQFE